MNYFDTVKERIADYIVKDPVEENEEVISAYTLFSIIESYNKRIRHTKAMGKGLLDKLNIIYPQETYKNKEKIFKKKTKANHFSDISYRINNNSSKIILQEFPHGTTSIEKDFNYSDIYTRDYNLLNEEAYSKCIGDIEKILSELSYLGNLFSEEIKSSGHKNSTLESYDTKLYNTIPCEGFDIKIGFDSFNISFNYDIALNKDFDPNGNSDSRYYNQDYKLSNIIEENKEAILKNTPVNIGDLSYMFCMLVLDYRATVEKKEEIKKQEAQMLILTV